MTNEIPDLEELLDITYRINEELTIAFQENIQRVVLVKTDFIKSIELNDSMPKLILVTNGVYVEISYSGVVIWDGSESNILDIEDYIRLHLDILMNLIYNGNLLNTDVLFCKDKDSKEFYLS